MLKSILNSCCVNFCIMLLSVKIVWVTETLFCGNINMIFYCDLIIFQEDFFSMSLILSKFWSHFKRSTLFDMAAWPQVCIDWPHLSFLFISLSFTQFFFIIILCIAKISLIGLQQFRIFCSFFLKPDPMFDIFCSSGAETLCSKRFPDNKYWCSRELLTKFSKTNVCKFFWSPN